MTISAYYSRRCIKCISITYWTFTILNWCWCNPNGFSLRLRCNSRGSSLEEIINSLGNALHVGQMAIWLSFVTPIQNVLNLKRSYVSGTFSVWHITSILRVL